MSCHPNCVLDDQPLEIVLFTSLQLSGNGHGIDARLGSVVEMRMQCDACASAWPLEQR